MRAYERLLRYVKINTTSDPGSDSLPSSVRQFDLAELLVEEMKELGIEDARVDEHCYVYGSLAATPGCEDRICLGLIAHMDTAPDFNGEGVTPLIWENYDGKDIVLNEKCSLQVEQFPHLTGLKGKTLITTDGSSLLGSDDKAGIAAILTMAEELIREKTPHGRIAIAFTPDEEIAHGAAALDLAAFGADFAYTVDGGPVEEIQYENFNAGSAEFIIKGVCVHPGEAKNRMVNAALLAAKITGMLPEAETPSNTEGREGFYHLTQIQGNMEEARLSYIIRDHDRSIYEARLQTLRMIEKRLNERYGAGTVTLTIREQYRNMLEKIRPCMHLIDYAREAVKEIGLTSVEMPIRGGTDGARLSFRGLPCPNLGSGGYAFHGPFEHITIEDMDQVVKVLKGIIKRYAYIPSDMLRQGGWLGGCDHLVDDPAEQEH